MASSSRTSSKAVLPAASAATASGFGAFFGALGFSGALALAAGGATTVSSPRVFSSLSNSVVNLPAAVSLAPSEATNGTMTRRGASAAWAASPRQTVRARSRERWQDIGIGC